MAHLIFLKKLLAQYLTFDTETTFLVKNLSDQLLPNYLFSINTTLESIKQMNQKLFKVFINFQCPRDAFRTLSNI